MANPWFDALDHAWRAYTESLDVDRFREEIQTNPAFDDEGHSLSQLLQRAVLAKDRSAAKLLLELGADTSAPDPWGPTVWTAVYDSGGETDFVRILLENGADLHARGSNDWTALHVAASRGYGDVVDLLLDFGAEIDDRTNVDGCLTPLMEAAETGQVDVIRRLLARGARPDLRESYFGRTAREIAERNGHVEAAALLPVAPSNRRP